MLPQWLQQLQKMRKEEVMMLRSVIFDLDGLLIDSEMTAYHVDRDILRAYGHEFSLAHYAEKYCGRTILRNMTDFIAEYALPISVEEGIRQYEEREAACIRQGIPLKSGARELLAYLKERGCVISLASSSIASRARTILDGNGVTDYFDYFTFGPEVENGKPAPDIFLKALSKTGAAPEESLVLEDSEAGIKAAVSAHIPVACVPDVARPSAETLEKAVGVFDSLLQVMEWIKAK